MNTEEKLAYWAGVMKRYEASSLKQGVFCQKEGLSLSSFYKWRSLVFANHRNQEAQIQECHLRAFVEQQRPWS